MRPRPSSIPRAERRDPIRPDRCSRPIVPGFTLTEVLVALVVVAVLAAVILPHAVDTVRRGRAAALARNLDAVADALTDFRGDIGRYPSQLAYLTAAPVTGAVDTCARPIGVDWSTVWQGPYLQLGIGAGGIRTGDATIQNAVTRDPPTIPEGVLAELLIRAIDVDQAIAEELDAVFDGTADLANGTIRWVDQGGGRGTLTFAMPIRGC